MAMVALADGIGVCDGRGVEVGIGVLVGRGVLEAVLVRVGKGVRVAVWLGTGVAVREAVAVREVVLEAVGLTICTVFGVLDAMRVALLV